MLRKSLSLMFAVCLLIAAFTLLPAAAFAASGDETSATEQSEITEAPVITGFENIADGTVIRWQAYDGAASYRVFVWNDTVWQSLCSTTELSCTHSPLTDGAVYSYSLVAVDENGDLLAQPGDAVFEHTFFAPPVISSASNSGEGVVIRWSAADSAESFEVFRSEADGVQIRVGVTDKNEFTDTSAVSGKTYVYTVRCIAADTGEALSGLSVSKSVYYVAAPVIKSFSNTATGTKLTWTKTEGSARYRVYYKGASGWVRLTETDSDSYTHDKLTPGTSYTYTVRSLDAKGNFASGYSADGWSNTFIEPPVITSLTNTTEGIEIRWNKPKGSEKYRVYYYGSKGWTALAETTDNVYLDKDVLSGYNFTYTVRCISSDSKSFTSYHNSGKKTMFVAAPKITSISNTLTGSTLSWSQPKGAVRYRVYYKSLTGWKRITETASNTCTLDKLTSGADYTFTVRCVDANGDFTSGFYSEGWTNTFISAPVITSFTNTSEGIEIRWSEPKGAVNYRVYYYGSKGWTKLAETTDNVFLDKDVISGYHYTYTVRCISEDGKSFTSYHNSGKKTQYVGVPAISSIVNTESGAKITWNKVTGADFYRIYYKNSSGGWTRLASKYLTEYVDTGVKNGETRVYTIRCLDKNENFVSDYSKTGWSNTYYAAPSISSVTSSSKGNVITWKSANGVAAYRLYRKTFGGSWTRLFDSTTKTSYTDASASSGKIYAYTLRYLDANGNLISDYTDNVKYYKNGSPVNGNVFINGTYGFKDGYLMKGLNRVSGKLRYYNSEGRMYRDTLVGTASTGYYYTDADGICCESKEMRLAAEFMVKYCKGNTLKEKMKYAFMYMADNYPYVRVYNDMPDDEDDVPPFAIELFETKEGTCYRYAAAYACIAKIAGYRARFVYGLAGTLYHGWTEVYVDGEWLYCDVDANIPSYGNADYAAYMMETHMWSLTKNWYSELTIKDGQAVWGSIVYY